MKEYRKQNEDQKHQNQHKKHQNQRKSTKICEILQNARKMKENEVESRLEKLISGSGPDHFRRWPGGMREAVLRQFCLILP